jgi:hypothetical protein
MSLLLNQPKFHCEKTKMQNIFANRNGKKNINISLHLQSNHDSAILKILPPNKKNILIVLQKHLEAS